jgi:hypothetical protein
MAVVCQALLDAVFKDYESAVITLNIWKSTLPMTLL